MLTAAGLTRKTGTLKRRIHVAFVFHPRTLTFYRPLRRAVRRMRGSFCVRERYGIQPGSSAACLIQLASNSSSSSSSSWMSR